MAQSPIVALEMGTTHMRALVGEAQEDGGLMVIGGGFEPSRGVRKGEVTNLQHALTTLKTALHKAEEQSDVAVREAYLCLSGAHLRSFVKSGTIPVMNPEREIGQEEIDSVMEVARDVDLAEDRVILHTINQQFSVEGQEGVLDPRGMVGRNLSLDVLVLHGTESRVMNTVKVVQDVPLTVCNTVFSGVCSALAVLTPEQKESGVAVIDLGGGTTDVVVYAGRAVAHAASLGVGGDHVTNDTALGLKLPMQQAERLKREHGQARVDYALRGRRVAVPPEGSFPGRDVLLTDLHLVMHARLEETLELVRYQLEEKGLLHQLGAGVVLTGGGAHVSGICELAERVFDLPCMVGRPQDVNGVPGVPVDDPALASAVGLLLYAMRQNRPRRRGGLVDMIKRWVGTDDA